MNHWDKAIVKRAADKMQERLTAMQARCEKQNLDQLIVSHEIGRLLGQNTRAAKLFEVNLLTKEELWKAYIQLTEAEKAFRIHKMDLSLRPVWHQKED